MNPRPHDYFIAGTDTEVGKTFVSAALIHAFASKGLRTLGMKPIAAGARAIDGVWHNDDLDSLIAASNVSCPTSLLCPYLMRIPAAPHIVAVLEQVQIVPQTILSAYQQLTQLADAVIVEGVGGFCVPLTADYTTADLAHDLALPVILVVGMRLGCINHALLSAQAIAAQGLTLAGWVANTVDPTMTYVAENIEALCSRLPAPLLGHVPRLAQPSAQAAAGFLNVNLLK